ncbi:hypothetical protein ANANG_G00027400 [Anguilla anguilla]|uniref:SRCR domain-containing protein n=1 Tax=Anguilla anguilla TaxID=7936 RepID=A0A9D3MRD7_ANGAN|nr:hypothetical protein ANANG_G00027400 [Anguilla anguilla]
MCSGYTESRLADGPDNCSGRVELQHLGNWGTVCDACWDRRASNVLCQQLKCGTAVAVPGQAWFGEGSWPIRADVFDCHGNETRLSQCAVSSWSRAVLSHGLDAGVICSGSALSALDGTVRLAGEGACEGQVEVYYQQTWSRVGGSWSFSEASVACRQLGCGSAVQVYSSSPSGTGGSGECLMGVQCSGREAHLGNCSTPHKLTCSSREQVSIVCSRNGPVWLDEVGCVGNETSLWDCPTAGWGQTDCGHKKDVGVVCSGHWPIRLVGGEGGCSGMLEVFHEGSWRKVCGDSWDAMDVQVVCRQLGCGSAGKAHSNATFGMGKDDPWLTEVNCRGTEMHLWDCPHQHSRCQHQNQAGVTCTGPLYESSSAAVVSTQPVPRLKEAPASPCIPAVAFLVMGALLFLLLAVLGVLLFQNRALKRRENFLAPESPPAPRGMDYDDVGE